MEPVSPRQALYTISADEALAQTTPVMFSTLPRRNPLYQPIADTGGMRRESNFVGLTPGGNAGGGGHNASPYGPSPVHSKALQSLATLANKYLTTHKQTISNYTIHNEQMAYLRAIERNDIEEVKEILNVYDLRNEISSSSEEGDSYTDEQFNMLPSTSNSRDKLNGNSVHKRPSLHVESELPFIMEMKTLEKRESHLTKGASDDALEQQNKASTKNSKGHSVKLPKIKRQKPSDTSPTSGSQKRNRQVFDKNCRDQWGRSGLFIAISRRNLEMIDLLLQSQVEIGECLYHTIDFGYYDVVELLLKHDKLRDQVISGEDSFYPPGLTPIQLAAHKNDFIMLKILHNYEFRIMGEKEKDRQKKRVFSKKMKSATEITHYYQLEKAWDQSNDRILYYRAMASPAYLIMMHTEGGFSDEPQDHDFMDRIFRLYGKLKKKANQEPDARSMYLQLSTQVENFACDLLNEVRSAEDLSEFLRFDPPGHSRATLPKNHLLPVQTACEVHMKNFVAHQHCQLTLSILRMGTLFESDGAWKTLFIRFLLAILFPFLSIFFIIAPQSRLGSLLCNPMVNLSCHMFSEISFLVLMVVRLIAMWYGKCDCLGMPPNGIEYVILLWVLARTVNEIKRIREVRFAKLMSNVWKLNDFATLLMFYIVIGLRMVDMIRFNGGYNENIGAHNGTCGQLKFGKICDRSKWTPEEYWPLLVSEGCMSFIYLLIFIRAMEMMYIDRTFGPLQLSLDKMLLDVMRFVISFFMFTFFAFACGMTQLYWAYGTPRLERLGSASWSNVTVCGEDQVGNANCYPVYSSIPTSLLEQFWTIFGYGFTSEPPQALETPDNKDLTKYAGMVLSGLFHCWAVVVMLNMLIAMMSHSFDRVRDNAEVEWKFHRTNTWMKYIRKGVYPRPPPMNLIPSPRDIKSIYNSMKSLISRCLGKHHYSNPERRKAHRTEMSQNNKENARYRQAINRVTNRYLRKHLLEEFQHDEDNQLLLQQSSKNASPRKLSAVR